MADVQKVSNPVLTQYITLLNRVYIGSVSFELKEPELATIFCQFGGIKNINVSYEGSTTVHKGYCFVEFDNPEAAVLAISKLDGVSCGGRTMRIGRPHNFPTELPPGIPKPAPNRIYLCNIHEFITEDEIRALCLAADIATKSHKGYCYVDFCEERSALRAVKALDGLFLAGFTVYAVLNYAALPLPISMSTVSKSGVHSSASNPGHGPQKRGYDPKNSLFSLAESTAICIRGILQKHQLDEFFEDEVRRELEKFGKVSGFHVFIDDRDETADSVHVFCRYDAFASADRALVALNGRFFAGKRLVVEKYPLIRYEIKDFYC